jgi:hypothetical protein
MSSPSILRLTPYSYFSWNSASPYKSLITKSSYSFDLPFPCTSKSHANFWRLCVCLQLNFLKRRIYRTTYKIETIL